MSFLPVGTILATTTTSLTVNPTGVGHLILVEVTAFPNTAYCTGISGGNCTWVQVGNKLLGSNVLHTAIVYAGTSTATGSATATLSFNATPGNIAAAGQQFISTVGSWALESQGNEDDASATTNYPTLTPHGSGELYFAYCYNNGTESPGTTPGFTYQNDGGGNGLCYNLNCSGTQTPVWADSDTRLGIAVLMRETPQTSLPQPITRAKTQTFSRGRTRSTPPAVLQPGAKGPVFRQARSVRTYPVPALKGRVIPGSRGAPVRNPVKGPVFNPFRAPVRIHPPKPPRGRIASNKGGPRNNPTPLSGSILPGYVYPSFLGSYWNQFLASTGKLPNVVILNSGSGDVAWNSDYEGLCTSLHALGITVLGYTYSNYGTRPAATVEAAVGNYLGAGITPGGNGVDGIFIDQFQSAAGGFSYYSGICTSIQAQFLAGGGSPTPPIWGNPGTYLDSSYLALPTTAFVTFEGNVANYLRNTPYNVSTAGTPNAGTAFARSRFAHLVYGTARDQVDGVVDRGYANYAGWVFATNAPGDSNPYAFIPGNDYLNDLMTRAGQAPVQFPVGIPPYIYPQISPARVHPSLPKRGRAHKNPGSPVLSYPQPFPAASATFTATPGVMLPGAIWPGNPYPLTPFRFTGHYPVYYLDYLDGTTRGTLYAQPGGTYFMLVANTRAGLTIPPGDGRWLGEAPQQDEVPLHRKVFLKLRQHIHRSRKRSGYRNPPGDAG